MQLMRAGSPATGAALDPDRAYRLAAGVRVRERAGGDIQIGADPPHCLLLRDAPEGSAALLGELAHGVVPRTWWSARGMEPTAWRPVFGHLLAAHLLVPADAAAAPLDSRHDVHLQGERSALVRRHGGRAAARALQARADALVVVRGSGRLATAVAAQLATAGVGHVHPRPDDLDLRRERSTTGPPRPTVAGGGSAGSAPDVARRLVALVRQASPTVRSHAPAAHVPPVLTVLAGDSPVDLGVAAELMHDRLPHLAVHAGPARAVVGPLVLPGRSSCLICALRHRMDADPSWPPEAGCAPVGGSTVLVQTAAARAVHEALEFVDGLAAPSSVDGTLEWSLDGVGPRRRTWSRHPECGCRTPASAHLSVVPDP